MITTDATESIVNLQVHTKVNDDLLKTLDSLDLTLNDVFKMLVDHLMIRKTLPEELMPRCTPNAETIALLKSIEDGTAEMRGPFTYEEYLAYMESDEDL